ncbi:hypothetical protein D3C78_568540 [compost metagenome]
MLRVPLQCALKPWVTELHQGLIDTCAEPAQFSDQRWFHVLEPGQWLTFDVLKQTHAQGLALHLQCQ